MRWSSGSTSGSSIAPSRSASRAPSPRCASSGVAPGGAATGLAVLIASEDALDQFFMREPEALLERRVEATRLDHANPRILDPHVYAAAYEGPVGPADADTLGPEALERAAHPARARANARRLRLEGTRRTGGAVLAPLRQPGLVRDRRRDDRIGARPRRARARLLERPRGRGLPPPRRAVPRAGARPRRPHGSRRARRGRLVHAGQEGHEYGDRGDRSGALASRASSSSSDASRSPSR